ncbi:MAG: hypothetical protein Q8O93_01990 [bacterium]|nr:hypothetical protein [bacterium]
MKAKIITALLSFFLMGCGFLSGPQWVKSETKITVTQDGTVTENSYRRTTNGLSGNDPETATSWAEANLMLGMVGGKTKNSVVGDSANARGFIKNDKHRPLHFTLKKGGLVIYQAVVGARATIIYDGPNWGDYQTIWSDGRRKDIKPLRVRPYTAVEVEICQPNYKDCKTERGNWLSYMPP